MHPEVTSESRACPKCGMKLVPAQLAGGRPEHGSHEHHGSMSTATATRRARRIEWEDDMVEVNRMTTPANMRWTIVDRATGAEGHAIDWTFRVGDRVKIRIENTLESDHPMHHPFHIHGAGRFLVLARDGADGSRTSSGRTRFSWRPARPWTSCSTSRTRDSGWRTATSPSTTRAG